MQNANKAPQDLDQKPSLGPHEVHPIFRLITNQDVEILRQYESLLNLTEAPKPNQLAETPKPVVMPSDPAFRARTHCLPRSRSLERVGNVATLTRVTSVPNISSFRVGSTRYTPSTLHKYRRDFDSLDDWNIDRYTFYTPFYWQTYRFAARRSLFTDPIPDSLGFEAPAFWSRYKWYTDWLNPTYWRRYRDPNYDRPLWNSWRPWQLDRVNVKGAIDMYRNGVIDFKTLDKKWIEPTALGRRGKDWADVYLPAARYGAHRYFYSFS